MLITFGRNIWFWHDVLEECRMLELVYLVLCLELHNLLLARIRSGLRNYAIKINIVQLRRKEDGMK